MWKRPLLQRPNWQLDEISKEYFREGSHIAMLRKNQDGTKTPLTLPNHKRIKGSTLRHICSQVGINRKRFLEIYEKV